MTELEVEEALGLIELEVAIIEEEGADDRVEDSVLDVLEGVTAEEEEDEDPPVNLGDLGFGIREGDDDDDSDDLTAWTVIVPRFSILAEPRNRLSKLETTANDLRTGVVEGVTEIEAATTVRFSFGFDEMRDRRWTGTGDEGIAERLVLGLGTTTGSPRDRRSRG